MVYLLVILITVVKVQPRHEFRLRLALGESSDLRSHLLRALRALFPPKTGVMAET
jgi:hypothetical protein